jgi:signal transduction histidine kinase
MSHPPHHPHRGPARVPRWPWLLLAVAVLLQVMSCGSWRRLSMVEGAGLLLLRDGPQAQLRVLPLTVEAESKLAGLRHPIAVLSVGDLRATEEPLRSFVGADRPGKGSALPRALANSNVPYRLRDATGRERVVRVSIGLLDPSVLAGWCQRPLLQQIVGLLYLAIGVLVWLRRPDDPSTPTVVFICTCASLNMQVFIGHGALSRMIDPLRMSIISVWAAAAPHLAMVFTGQGDHPTLRRLVRVGWGIGALLTLTVFTLSVAAPWSALRIPVIATGVFALSSLALAAYLTVRAVRSERSLALRRRARLLGFAMLCAFGFPSLTLVLGPLNIAGEWLFSVNAVCFATFPLIVGYAILRHRLFDLRIVLRRGLVYGLLTSGVSVAYLGMVVLVAKLAKQGPSPFFLAVSVAGAVVLFGLLHARVQRAVDRFVYRSRYVYGEAIARASAALSHDRTEVAIRETVRSALIEAMQLERAYFVTWTDRRARQSLQVQPLEADQRGEKRRRCPMHAEHREQVHPLPETVEPSSARPLLRALSTGVLVTTYDASAVAELSRAGHGESLDPSSEAGFWLAYGLEAIVPLTLGGEASGGKVLGLLLLGPKCDGRRLDDEDLAMLQTLANQVSVAIESANAFAEIQRLNTGLEQTVAERTAELERALDNMKQMQGQLIETETQAVLGRVVAGIVHEVNTPLGGLRSGTDTLGKVLDRVEPLLANLGEDTTPSAEQRRALKALAKGRELTDLLRQSGERIGGVLGSLQRFVSLDEAEVKPYDLRRGLEDVLTLLGPRLPESIAVERELPEEPLIVSCQAAKLNRAFLNVLDNAIGAIEGAGTIRVAARWSGSGTYEVLIEDSGRGIPAKERGKLFEVDLAAKRDGRVGLRLGLPSSKRWVEELGGALRVDSEVGRGTRVVFLLPAATAKQRGCVGKVDAD